jgi:TadE-like protein
MTRGALQGASRSERGQGLVEFALVLPLLMILLLGIADFGRIFQAGIAEEAAVRNAAEAAAEQYNQYLQCGVGNPDPTCGGLPDPTQYAALHADALTVACREAERMPSRAVDGLGNCTMPITAVCVHDTAGDVIGGGDSNGCGQEASGAPAACDRMNAPWSSARISPTEVTDPFGGRPYVEVRMCYRFDPLFAFALGSWGSIWMEKTNFFVVTNY